MYKNLNEIYFGEFRYSVAERCLFRGNELVPLSGKEREVLAALLEADGQVVERENLWQRLWPDKQVEPSNLHHHIKSLRAKLGSREDGKNFVETIPGQGYRLLVFEDGATRPQTLTSDSELHDIAPPTTQPVPNRIQKLWSWRRIAAIASISIMLLTGGFLLSRRKGPGAERKADVSIMTSPETLRNPRLLKLIEVGPQASSAVLIEKRHELYVSDQGNAVSVIDTDRDVVVSRIATGSSPNKLASTIDGNYILIAQAGGGVGKIDVSSHLFRYASTFRGAVQDLAVTPDGKNAYLALGFEGVAKLDLESEKIDTISKVIFARALALTPDGRRLYVSYQAKGPGGSYGHDAIGYFDTVTDQFAGSLTGFPNVGECLSASPDNSQVWENGADACVSPQYDHAGCPFVPGGLLNIVHTSTNQLHSVGVRGALLQCSTFSPDGAFAAVGTTDSLMLVRVRDLAVLGSLPIGSTGRIAFASDGFKAYVPVNAKPQVAVIELGAQVSVVRLSNHTEQPSIQVAIRSDPDFDAKTIDPGSLRLAGAPAEKREDGLLDASIEHLDGYQGHSLVVRFSLEAEKSSADLQLVGKTFGGTPIHGTVAVN